MKDRTIGLPAGTYTNKTLGKVRVQYSSLLLDRFDPQTTLKMGGHSRSDNKGPTLLILTCILTSLAIITTGLRCWVRWGNRQLGFDDGAMVLTTGLAVARMCIQIVSVRYGNGKHRDFVSEHDYQTINMLTWYTQVLLFPTICLMKVSICILILRIKDTRTLRCILGIVITGLILTNFECLVVLLAECSPLRAYWDGTSATHCWPAKVRIYSIYLQACSYRYTRLLAHTHILQHTRSQRI
jgi:hypothetical protein